MSASAIAFVNASLFLLPKAFQLFQPIVGRRPFFLFKSTFPFEKAGNIYSGSVITAGALLDVAIDELLFFCLFILCPLKNLSFFLGDAFLIEDRKSTRLN